MRLPPSRSARRDGFTVLELLAALVLVGLLAAIAAPRLPIAPYQADAAGREVRVALQAAQRLAITQQSIVVVGFDSASRRLRLLEDVNGNLRADAGERVTWRAFDAEARFATPATPLPGWPSAGALVQVGPRVIDGLPSLVFRRDGSASATAAIYLQVRRPRDEAWRAYVVTQATGRVEGWRARGTPQSWQRSGL